MDGLVRPKAIFSIPDGSSDSLPDDAYGDAEDFADDGPWSATSSRHHLPPRDLDTRLQRQKNDTRRHYALTELLDTECGYLDDLKVLVDVYLSNLPTLAFPSRTRSASSLQLPSRRHSAHPPSPAVATNQPSNGLLGRSLSNSFIQGAGVPPRARTLSSNLTVPAAVSASATVGYVQSFASGLLLPESESPAANYTQSPMSTLSVLPSPESVPAPTTSTTQPLLSNDEMSILSRNASALLDLHSRFVTALQKCVSDVGYIFGNPATQDTPTNNVGKGKVKEEGDSVDNVDEAVVAICEHFIKEASHFNIYQPFCAGHTEALDLVRRVQKDHHAQWDKWEKKCATQAVSHMQNERISTDSGSGREEAEWIEVITVTSPGQRRHSTPTLSTDLTFELNQKASSVEPSADSETTQHTTRPMAALKHTNSDPARSTRAPAQPRLSFVDYLIKPVQRICKYPLLLEQLRTVKIVRPRRSREEKERARERASALTPIGAEHSPEPSIYDPETPQGEKHVDGSVDHALHSMRAVALAVDEARRRKDILTRSHLIATRLEAHARCPLPKPFLQSLGACLLAGSMDVVHYDSGRSEAGGSMRLGARARGPVKVKYFGAFLYVGGYIVLVKVSKANVYEVKHWFSLTGFEMADLEEQDALLPCSFSLESPGHHFELAAACQREKDVWMSAIREARAVTPSWVQEPMSSLTLDGPLYHVPTLPTVHSMEEVDDEMMPPLMQPSMKASSSTLRVGPKPSASATTLKAEPSLMTMKQPQPQQSASARPSPPPRSASLKSIFVPVSDDATILIRRSSAARRAQVDRLLLDVLSEPCLSARFQAQAHEEALFRDPAAGGVMPVSSFGMGIATKNKLTRRESVLVTRQRASGAASDGETHAGGVSETELSNGNEIGNGISGSSSGTLVTRAKSLAARRRNRKSLRVKPTLSTLFTETEDSDGVHISYSAPSPSSPDSPQQRSHSPEPMSQCSSVTNSITYSDVVVSPVADEFPPTVRVVGVDTSTRASELPDMVAPEDRPKRTRSLVDNVRGFFGNRTPSPVPSLSTYCSDLSAVDASTKEKDRLRPRTPQPQSALTKLWRSASMRRRVRSAPDAPGSPDSSTETTPELAPRSRKRSSGQSNSESLARSPTSVSMSALDRKRHSSDDTHAHDAGISEAAAHPEAPQRRRTLLYSGDHSLRRTFKNRLFFHNMNPLTPIATDTSS